MNVVWGVLALILVVAGLVILAAIVLELVRLERANRQRQAYVEDPLPEVLTLEGDDSRSWALRHLMESAHAVSWDTNGEANRLDCEAKP